jgi:hypothetical protein
MTFRDIIALWGSAEALATDLRTSGVTVRAWRNRDSIPGGWWTLIVDAAAARGIQGVSLEVLARAAQKARAA